MRRATKRAGARALATMLLGALAGTAAAQETNIEAQNRGPYVGLGAGVNFQERNHIRFDGVNDTTTYHAGYVGVASAGYALGNGLRFEIEPGYRRNNVDQVAGVGGVGHTTIMTLMANAIYDIDYRAPVPFLRDLLPHIGAGAGVARVLNRSAANVAGATLVTGHDTVPAFQAIAGVDYALSPGLKLGLDYRYLLAHNVNGFHTDAGSRAVAGDFNDHAILLTLRYEFGAPAARAQPAAGVMPPPMPPAAAVTPPPPPEPRNYAVYFDTNSTSLTPSAHGIIEQAAADMQQGLMKRVAVTGHTDTTGTAQHNQQLSERRADAVRAALISAGVPADRIVATGQGENAPQVPTGNDTDEPRNRRVLIAEQP